jgi:hypothetical protein
VDRQPLPPPNLPQEQARLNPCDPDSGGRGTQERIDGMTDPDVSDLRRRAANGDTEAVDELVQLAGEQGDMAELRRLADAGSSDAVDELVQLAGERGDTAELRRLADQGNRDAADMLTELADEAGDNHE